MNTDDDYFSIDISKEMRDIKGVLLVLVTSIDSLSAKIDSLERRIDTIEKQQDMLIDINKKLDTQTTRINVVYSMSHVLSDLKEKIEDLNERVDEHTKKLTETNTHIHKIERTGIQHGTAYHRIINAMLRKNDPIPFSLSSCVQNTPDNKR